jgi:hypothetical protein
MAGAQPSISPMSPLIITQKALMQATPIPNIPTQAKVMHDNTTRPTCGSDNHQTPKALQLAYGDHILASRAVHLGIFPSLQERSLTKVHGLSLHPTAHINLVTEAE